MRTIAIGLLATVALTACSSGGSGSGGAATPPPPGGAIPPASATMAEPRTEAAVRAAAREEFDSYASGDYGAAWDEWTASAKRVLSRADYMRLFELCPSAGQGVRFTIEKITMDSSTQAHVRTNRLVLLTTYEFRYEGGHWRFMPPAENMRDYRTKTVEKMVSERRTQGGCA